MMRKIGIVSIILLLIIIFLGYQFMKEYKFSELITEDIHKIESRNSGNGILYTTTDKDVINKLLSKMNSTNYNKRIFSANYTGPTPLILYNIEGKKIGKIIFYPNNMLKINGNKYRSKSDINLKDFFIDLYADKNITND